MDHERQTNKQQHSCITHWTNNKDPLNRTPTTNPPTTPLSHPTRPTSDLPRSPEMPSRLQDPGLGAVRQQERVVVEQASVRVRARSALAVLRQ